MDNSMTDLPIRPEAIEAAAKAMDSGIRFEDHIRPIKEAILASTEAAIAAFCEAEGLTVERILVNHNPTEHRERLVGDWHNVKEKP